MSDQEKIVDKADDIIEVLSDLTLDERVEVMEVVNNWLMAYLRNRTVI
jgi:hypothetical protein